MQNFNVPIVEHSPNFLENDLSPKNKDELKIEIPVMTLNKQLLILNRILTYMLNMICSWLPMIDVFFEYSERLLETNNLKQTVLYRDEGEEIVFVDTSNLGYS